VATIHVAGVRGDPCHAVRWTAVLLHVLLPQHRDLQDFKLIAF